MEQLLEEELFLVDGGKNWWYIVGGSITTVAGVRREAEQWPPAGCR